MNLKRFDSYTLPPNDAYFMATFPRRSADGCKTVADDLRQLRVRDALDSLDGFGLRALHLMAVDR
jgi:hypothetical protein